MRPFSSFLPGTTVVGVVLLIMFLSMILPAHPTIAKTTESATPQTPSTTPTWTFITSTGPGSRIDFSMTYDVADRYVLLFGGRSVSTFRDTWKFQGGTWTNITSSAGTGPGQRSLAAIAYDAADGYVVLFGGRTAGACCFGDTWKFSGGVWTNITTGGGPSPRVAAMTYDAADGHVLLFGGIGNTGPGIVGDTWKFKAGTWTQITTSGPSARNNPGIAYDDADGYAVLFGGHAVNSPPPNFESGDTWKFLSGTWTNITSPGPSPRSEDSMVYDAADGYVILTGGNTGTSKGDTWKFLAGSWTNITSIVGNGPGGSLSPGLVYDAADGYVVFFYGNTWKLSPATSIPFDYSLSNNGPVSIQQGHSDTVTITATLTASTAQPVTLSCSGLPVGITCGAFIVNPVTPTTPGATSFLPVNVAISVAPGAYSLQVVGSPKGATASAAVTTVSLTVVPLPIPTLTTVLKDSNGNPVTSIVAGALAHDTATITPTPPSTITTGMVTYTVYSNGACTGQPFVTPDQVTIMPTGTVPDSAPGTAGPGTYSVQATYSGDPNNSPAASPCEVLTITKASPTITSSVSPATVTIGGSASDLATLSGGFNPSGNVTYTAYSDTACKTQAFASPNVSLGTASSAFTPLTAGAYYFVARYNGDANNNPISTTCGSQSETLTVIPTTTQPVLLTFTGTNLDDFDNGIGQLQVFVNGHLVVDIPAGLNHLTGSGDYASYTDTSVNFGPFDITSFVVNGQNNITFADHDPADHFGVIRNVTIAQGKTILLHVSSRVGIYPEFAKTYTFSIPPVVLTSFTVSNQNPTIGETVTFTVTYAGGTAPFKCIFNFGDGETAVVMGSNGKCSTTHDYERSGTIHATVRIRGASTSDNIVGGLSLTVANHDSPMLSSNVLETPDSERESVQT